jgi:hypothetical protein
VPGSVLSGNCDPDLTKQTQSGVTSRVAHPWAIGVSLKSSDPRHRR